MLVETTYCSLRKLARFLRHSVDMDVLRYYTRCVTHDKVSSRGQSSRTHEAEVRFGSLAAACRY